MKAILFALLAFAAPAAHADYFYECYCTTCQRAPAATT